MTTYSDFVARVRRIALDPSLADALIYDGVCAGLDAILPWVAKRSNQTITGDGTETEFELEDDLYEIDAVELTDSGEFLPCAMLAPGEVRGAYMAGDNNWIEYPTGTLSLSTALESGDTAKIYYRAHWDKPTSSTDTGFVLTIPAYLEYAVSLFASGYALTPSAVETATIRQFNSKVDSGVPIHNPMADRVSFLFDLFQAQMSLHPRQIAGSLVP